LSSRRNTWRVNDSQFDGLSPTRTCADAIRQGKPTVNYELRATASVAQLPGQGISSSRLLAAFARGFTFIWAISVLADHWEPTRFLNHKFISDLPANDCLAGCLACELRTESKVRSDCPARVPGMRPASSLGFAGRVRCYNVAYENDVCPRIAHQHVEARTRGSRGRSNRDREAWRTRCGVASSKFSAAHGRCKEGADLRFHAKSLGSHAAS
jgi:hypothetical protein